MREVKHKSKPHFSRPTSRFKDKKFYMPTKTSTEPTLLSLTLADGEKTAISIFTSMVTQPSKTPILIVLPAMGVRAAYYQTLAESITNKGYHVVTADHRGLGHSSVRASRKVDFGYYDILTHDLPAIISAVKQHFPNHPIYLMGHSLGGHFAMLYASLHPKQLQGLIFVAAGSPYYKGWGRRAPLYWMATQGFYAISKVLGYFPGKYIGFGGKEARTLMKDWGHLARTGSFKIENYPLDFETLISKINLPVLSISLEGDDFAPPKAIQNFNTKLQNADVSYFHLAPKEGEHFNHFNWVKKNQSVLSHIENWLNK